MDPCEYANLKTTELINFFIKFYPDKKEIFYEMEEDVRENIEHIIYASGEIPSDIELIDDIFIEWLPDCDIIYILFSMIEKNL
jgi:hypothetical protein